MIKITTIDGINHLIPLVDGNPVFSGINSTNTIAALRVAYAADDWEPYTPPEPELLPPEPNPSAFRAELASSPTWLDWAYTLSSVAYTNLTIAAAQGNWGEAQAIYNRIIVDSPPQTGAASEWQAIANANGIPIAF